VKDEPSATSASRRAARSTPGRPAHTEAPASRPSKRREAAEDLVEEPEAEDDKFPWHFQFQDDEPEELHAKSPLLARAFRSSVG
jgi:hypothetical protein